MIIPYNSNRCWSIYYSHTHTRNEPNTGFDKNTALYWNTMVSLCGLLLGGETAYFGTRLNSLAIIIACPLSSPARLRVMESTSHFAWKQAFNFDLADEKTILAYSNEETNSCKNMRIARGGSIDGSIFPVYCLSSISTTAGHSSGFNADQWYRQRPKTGFPLSIITIDYIRIEYKFMFSNIYGARNNIFNNSLSRYNGLPRNSWRWKYREKIFANSFFFFSFPSLLNVHCTGNSNDGEW